MVATEACAAAVMKFAPTTERATSRNSRIIPRTRSGASGVAPMNQSSSAGPSRSRKKSAINISTNRRLNRASIASAPERAFSAQRPPAPNGDPARLSSVGSSFADRCNQPSIGSGALAISPLIPSDSMMSRTSPTTWVASRMAMIASSATGIRIRMTVAAVKSVAPKERRPPRCRTADS